MAKRATTATEGKFVIKVGHLFLSADKKLVEKARAKPFDNHSAALQFASDVFNDKNEHKYKIVPR